MYLLAIAPLAWGALLAGMTLLPYLGEKAVSWFHKDKAEEAEREFKGKKRAEESEFIAMLQEEDKRGRMHQAVPEMLQKIMTLIAASPGSPDVSEAVRAAERTTVNPTSPFAGDNAAYEQISKNAMESMVVPESPYVTSREGMRGSDAGEVLAAAIGSNKKEIKELTTPPQPPLIRMLGYNGQMPMRSTPSNYA